MTEPTTEELAEFWADYAERPMHRKDTVYGPTVAHIALIAAQTATRLRDLEAENATLRAQIPCRPGCASRFCQHQFKYAKTGVCIAVLSASI